MAVLFCKIIEYQICVCCFFAAHIPLMKKSIESIFVKTSDTREKSLSDLRCKNKSVQKHWLGEDMVNNYHLKRRSIVVDWSYDRKV
jgi:hypothetical protein